jgi:phosphoribosylformimino-5-aminoimidazole carboxamide ribonucleotide (ProFAR) isomerase
MGIIVGKALYTGGLYLPEAIMMAKSKKDLWFLQEGE